MNIFFLDFHLKRQFLEEKKKMSKGICAERERERERERETSSYATYTQVEIKFGLWAEKLKKTQEKGPLVVLELAESACDQEVLGSIPVFSKLFIR